MSKLTALLKPNGRIRGISAGEVFRRLVAKTLAKHYQEPLRAAVAPANFDLCYRHGIEALAHLVQFLTDEDPSTVVLTIDGVGAFDHVCRARFFEQLALNPELRTLIPFTQLWYCGVSEFRWRDTNGQAGT